MPIKKDEISQPGYYSVIPADVRYNANLTANAKLLYGEITALCCKEGYCWAVNRYFAELYDVEILAVKKWIKSLETEGYIRTELYDNNRRKIYLSESSLGMVGVSKKIRGSMQKHTRGYEKSPSTLLLNNTINNTNNKEKSFKKFFKERSGKEVTLRDGIMEVINKLRVE